MVPVAADMSSGQVTPPDRASGTNSKQQSLRRNLSTTLRKTGDFSLKSMWIAQRNSVYQQNYNTYSTQHNTCIDVACLNLYSYSVEVRYSCTVGSHLCIWNHSEWTVFCCSTQGLQWGALHSAATEHWPHERGKWNCRKYISWAIVCFIQAS